MDDNLKRVKNKQRYIVQLLKAQRRYSPELSMQAWLTAQLLVRIEKLAEEIFSEGYSTTLTEYSREGNPRETLNPTDRLYLELVKQAQSALKAMGMNTDAKERRPADDGFSDFMRSLRDEE